MHGYTFLGCTQFGHIIPPPPGATPTVHPTMRVHFGFLKTPSPANPSARFLSSYLPRGLFSFFFLLFGFPFFFFFGTFFARGHLHPQPLGQLQSLLSLSDARCVDISRRHSSRTLSLAPFRTRTTLRTVDISLIHPLPLSLSVKHFIFYHPAASPLCAKRNVNLVQTYAVYPSCYRQGARGAYFNVLLPLIFFFYFCPLQLQSF